MPSIKVLQYNVLFANDATQATPWGQRVGALRGWIAELNPDVLCLQEITQGEGVDMLGDLLEGSALSHRVFGVACRDVMPNQGQPGVVLGNAIASRCAHPPCYLPHTPPPARPAAGGPAHVGPRWT